MRQIQTILSVFENSDNFVVFGDFAMILKGLGAKKGLRGYKFVGLEKKVTDAWA
jgi:hypothetical protein